MERPVATFIDNNRLTLHRPYHLDLSCEDSKGTQKTVRGQLFWAADFKGYDVVLGYPWLREADPRIRFSTGEFEWWEDESERVHLVDDAAALLMDIQAGETPYILHPGGLVCTTLSDDDKYSLLQELHREPLEDPSLPARPSGDVAQDAEWYNRQGLLWVKNLMLEILDHLKHCVKDIPELEWLPRETAHRVVAGIRDRNPNRSTLPKGVGRIPPADKARDALRQPDVEDSFDEEEMRHVPKHLHHRWLAFSKRQTSRLRAYSDHDHAIDIKEGKNIPNLPIYNLSR